MSSALKSVCVASGSTHRVRRTGTFFFFKANFAVLFKNMFAFYQNWLLFSGKDTYPCTYARLHDNVWKTVVKPQAIYLTILSVSLIHVAHRSRNISSTRWRWMVCSGTFDSPQEPPVPTDGGWVARSISLDALARNSTAPSLSQIPVCPTLQNCWPPFFLTYE